MDALVRPDLMAMLAHIFGTALFSCVFLFLHRESRITYFGYWSLAWALLSAALACNLASVVTGRAVFLFPYAVLQLAFAASLLFASASVSGQFNIRLSYIALIVPALALAGYAAGQMGDFKGSYALLSLVLTITYGWNFVVFRRSWRPSGGTGQKLFAASLLFAALLHAHYALIYGATHVGAGAPVPAYLRWHDLYDLLFETVLAFAAMMMWMEEQHRQLEQANSELASSRREIARRARTDSLTGLLNRAALHEACESTDEVSGVLVVVDVDNFKHVNDTLGHLTGDEVLANIGSLIRASVRKGDDAWRWGGDEFVMLFRGQARESVEERIGRLAERLLHFRLRGKGELPVHLSWGLAELENRSLRQALDEADHQMYLRKRDKLSISKLFG
jgi:diguanylate cyclase (GGDEF)-like protein